jgi:hypothetical protein
LSGKLLWSRKTTGKEEEGEEEKTTEKGKEKKEGKKKTRAVSGTEALKKHFRKEYKEMYLEPEDKDLLEGYGKVFEPKKIPTELKEGKDEKRKDRGGKKKKEKGEEQIPKMECGYGVTEALLGQQFGYAHVPTTSKRLAFRRPKGWEAGNFVGERRRWEGNNFFQYLQSS